MSSDTLRTTWSAVLIQLPSWTAVAGSVTEANLSFWAPSYLGWMPSDGGKWPQSNEPPFTAAPVTGRRQRMRRHVRLTWSEKLLARRRAAPPADTAADFLQAPDDVVFDRDFLLGVFLSPFDSTYDSRRLFFYSIATSISCTCLYTPGRWTLWSVIRTRTREPRFFLGVPFAITKTWNSLLNRL